MAVYDLGAYLVAADRETGWASDMMAARQSQALQLAECQAPKAATNSRCSPPDSVRV